jgi:Tol biopolymer transport system component
MVVSEKRMTVLKVNGWSEDGRQLVFVNSISALSVCLANNFSLYAKYVMLKLLGVF